MKFFIYLIFATLLLSSCNKDSLFSTCVEDFFEENDITPSDGTDLDCEIYVELWTNNGADYFTFGSHCIDMVTNIQDCNGNISTPGNEEYQNLLKNATHHGIIGVYE